MTTTPDQEPVTFTWNGVAIDCAPGDFEAMIALYRDMFSMNVVEREERWAALVDPHGDKCINIGAHDWYEPPVWPEVPQAQTKMMHFDVRVNDVPAAVAAALSLGAREAPHQSPERDPNKLRVMLDPAGHPFCLWS